MKKDYLKQAVQSAQRGIRRGAGGPFGAVIVLKGRVIAVAHNQVLKTNNPTRHAEVNAIGIASRKLKRFSLNDCSIYSTTEPCPMCFSAIHWSGIRHLVYSTTIQDVKRLGFNELSIPSQTMKRLGKSKMRIKKVSHVGCKQLLNDWKNLSQRRTY